MASLNGEGLSKRVVKAMWLFSWVQMSGILCSIVRVKLVALWIGAAGVGIFGLFNTAFDMLAALSQLGLRQSSVRDIASARSETALRSIIYVVRRWAWALGIAGAFLTLALSPVLSRLTFGDGSHVLGFVILSFAVLMSSVTNGELAVMQGMERLNKMARATVAGTLGGLAVSIPLYYFLGERSIVWSILAYVASQTAAVYLMRGKTPPPHPLPAPRQIVAQGRSFLLLGVYMTVTMFIAMAVNYIFIAWLNHEKGLEYVGQYQAGYTVINRYIGLIFTAIGLEFYPRLSKVADSPRRMSTFVSHEALVAVIVILPAAAMMMSLDGFIIRLLYSDEFINVVPYIDWAVAGTAFRALSWCMAFTLIAKGDGKVYLITETVSGLLFLALSYAGETLGGMAGLGIAYSVWYAIYLAIVALVYFGRYRMRLSGKVAVCFIGATLLIIICAAARHAGIYWLSWVIAGISALFAIYAMRRLLMRRRPAV